MVTHKIALTSVLLLAGGALLAGFALLGAGCTLHRPAPAARSSDCGPHDLDSAPSSDASQHSGAAATTAVLRVGGDFQAVAEFVQGEYRSGECRISTPLPEGYPPPTPPGAIEIKHYPTVRRAGIAGTMSPDWGMNLAFFPLFNHIKRRDIAMTSPVEVDYDGLGSTGATKPTGWTMSFLYRTPELGPEGVDPRDERILVEDVPPMTVVACGLRGPYKLEQVKAGLENLRSWLADQAEWEEAGAPRALFYNGPEVRARDKWSEVQIPIRRR